MHVLKISNACINHACVNICTFPLTSLALFLLLKGRRLEVLIWVVEVSCQQSLNLKKYVGKRKEKKQLLNEI